MRRQHGQLTPSYFVDVVCRYAVEAGIDATGSLEAVELEAGLLASPTLSVSVEKCLALWHEVMTRSNDPNFGLHFGEKVNRLATGHIITSLLLNCTTIGEALEKMTRYQSLSTDFFQTSLRREGEYVFRVIEPAVVEGVPLHRHHAEAALCVLAHTLRLLTRGRIQFVEAHFTHPRPTDIGEHQRIFACPSLFDQPRTELKFPRAVLAWPIPMADAQMLANLEHLAQSVERSIYQVESWSDRAACRIEQLLQQHQAPTLKGVAAALAISPRQLQNHLRHESTTFQILLDKQRQEAALSYLRESTSTLYDIACQLGFSGQSAFNHAFRRWLGISPTEYRRALRH
ncbi:putative HTH-type transcriptional regulator [Thermoflexales bacterium]|nr:putative HTH-type transcriptional regulator [Thermoflexales bacterium]